MCTAIETPPQTRGEVLRVSTHTVQLVPAFVLGMGVSVFLAITYILCVHGFLFFPGVHIQHSALAILLPDFILLSWPSLVLGLLESLGWGWYVALVFGILHNPFAARS